MGRGPAQNLSPDLALPNQTSLKEDIFMSAHTLADSSQKVGRPMPRKKVGRHWSSKFFSCLCGLCGLCAVKLAIHVWKVSVPFCSQSLQPGCTLLKQTAGHVFLGIREKSIKSWRAMIKLRSQKTSFTLFTSQLHGSQHIRRTIAQSICFKKANFGVLT